MIFEEYVVATDDDEIKEFLAHLDNAMHDENNRIPAMLIRFLIEDRLKFKNVHEVDCWIKNRLNNAKREYEEMIKMLAP